MDRFLLRWLVRLNDAVNALLRVVVGLLIVGMTLVVLLAVFFRYGLNASLVWSEEAARYLAVWLVFLGVSVAHRQAGHVSVTALLDALATRPRRIVKLVAQIAELCILVVIAWYGWVLTSNNFARGQISPALGIQLAWVYLAVPVGVGLTALTSLERALHDVMLSPGEERQLRQAAALPPDS